MGLKITAKIFGLLLMFFSLSMLTPLLVTYYYHEHTYLPFVSAFAISLTVGFCLWAPCRKVQQELPIRSGFLIVFLTWAIACVFGSLPFVLSYDPHLGFTRAFFETTSAITTVGATTLTNLDAMPKSILFYRQQLQFLGGMGVVILAIAVMPLLGLGGMQLFKAEATGPSKENKITPRITDTAKALWTIYVGLNLLCAIAYWLCGMGPFDAICYAFSTVATGGAAPHDAGINYYPFTSVYIVCMLFMFLGGTNFALHYLTYTQRHLKSYWTNLENRAYLFLVLLFGAITSVVLWIYNPEHQTLKMLVVEGYFQVISFFSTTGFVNDPAFHLWPSFLPLSLIFMGIIGACSGSTSGGIKIVRILVILKQITREIRQLIHPQGVFPVKLGDEIITQVVANRVWAFLSAYSVVFIILWLAMVATGVSIEESFYAIASCLSNVGTGLGAVATSFTSFHKIDLWIVSIAMMIGRLDVFKVRILLSPAFWKK